MTRDLAADWLAGKAVDLPETPASRPRAVKGFTCQRGHRWTDENTKWEPNHNGTLIRKCRTCRKAAARRRNADREYARKRYAQNAPTRRRLAAKVLAPDDPRHGTLNGYNNYRCRCDACRAASRAYGRERAEQLRREAENAELTRRRAVSVRAVSLDEHAERRFGMDRVAVGSEWDDAVYSEVAGRVA